jgi:dTDP-4-amino-4,6-dideoxygalactose transaminase
VTSVAAWSRAVQPFALDLSADEIAELQADLATILRSGSLILGPYTERFEDEFAKYVGCQHAVAVNSGTSALEVLLRAHDAEGRGIAVPTNTNFATVAAILRAGGRPRFLDMSARTFMPTLAMLEAAHVRYELAGVVWVHIGGLISPDFMEIVSFCRRNGMFLIEDAAHAHGSRFAGRQAGTLADGGAFSFFPTKVMTTMEGGMVTTDSDEIAQRARSLRNQGKRGVKFGGLHHDLGSSWRILEIAAAMGVIQLRNLDRMIAHRDRVARRLRQTLEMLGVPFCDFAHMDRASHYKLIVLCDANVSIDEVRRRFAESGVMLGGSVYEIPCHRQPVFGALPSAADALPGAEYWCPRHICPPITSRMNDDEIERVVQVFQSILPAVQVGRRMG